MTASDPAHAAVAAAATGAIGLFGGTFAPIHNGHLRFALEARERLGLEQVRLLPCAIPPHRSAPLVAPARRLQWVRMACDGERGLCVDGRELARPGPSYTFDTVNELAAETGAPLVLLLGSDAASLLDTWHRWRELLERCQLAVVTRPESPFEPGAALAHWLQDRRCDSAAQLRAAGPGHWLGFEIPPLAISSTRIRRLLKAGRSLRGLVPEAILNTLTPEDVRALTAHEYAAID